MDARPDADSAHTPPPGRVPLETREADRGLRAGHPAAHLQGKWGRALLLLFCCWHAGYLLYSIVPRVAGQDAPGAPLLDAYRCVTGSRQVWRLFHTIPLLRSLTMRLEAEISGGTRPSAGCLLPGFGSFPIEENSRFYTLAERLLTNPLGIPYREPYLRKINPLLNEGLPPAEQAPWVLVFEGEFIRNLFYFRVDKRLSIPFRKEFGLGKAQQEQPPTGSPQ
jgi:hypothetical protein